MITRLIVCHKTIVRTTHSIIVHQILLLANQHPDAYHYCIILVCNEYILYDHHQLYYISTNSNFSQVFYPLLLRDRTGKLVTAAVSHSYDSVGIGRKRQYIQAINISNLKVNLDMAAMVKWYQYIRVHGNRVYLYTGILYCGLHRISHIGTRCSIVFEIGFVEVNNN